MIGLTMENLKQNSMYFKLFYSKFNSMDIDKIEAKLSVIKSKNPYEFKKCIQQLKVEFEHCEEIELLNKIALIFSTFKIHSSVPLIIDKVCDQKYFSKGGTLLYSLEGLKFSNYRKDLNNLREKEVSFEMKQMLDLIGV
jgi:hypothetical protein